jgi:octaprenyl-diphosphate synthase
LGKPVASDLREGKATMAVIHAIEHCTAVERQQIEKVLHERALNGIRHTDVLDILTRYGSLDYAAVQANQYAQAAVSGLEGFPENEFKRALLWVPEFVVAREK